MAFSKAKKGILGSIWQGQNGITYLEMSGTPQLNMLRPGGIGYTFHGASI